MDSLSFDTLVARIRYLASRWPVLLHDGLMVPIAWLLAYWFRFNLDTIPAPFLDEAIALLPTVIAIHMVTFVIFGVPRGTWRFISLPDLITLVKAVVVGTAGVAIAVFLATRLVAVPRSVFLLHGVLLVILLAGPRVLYRLSKDHHISTKAEKKVLIVGAGAAGEMLVRDFHRAHPRIYEPVAFVDDDKGKHGKEIHGIRVLGDCETIPLLVSKLGAELILLAIPSANSVQMRRAVEWCERTDVPFRTLPKVQDMVSGEASPSDLRKVEIDDLLGRKPVSLDVDSISQTLQGKQILVTGGGGSIGSELCRQIARLAPACLVLVEQSEFNLYTISLELQRDHPDLKLIPLLGDVCDEAAIGHIFEKHKPDVVFHAAAYKHVPLLQDQARETARNNVMGTRVVADAADRNQVDTFVLISTDKAVNPTSMMGASKRVAEIYCQALQGHSKTHYITVRFGNVLGSAGSVVPLFRKQIDEGGPITVTHPEITRYFMTLSEACQLILQASVIGGGSEIYVLNMGEPIKIAYLARQLVRLSGMTPGEDIEIVYTGLRPGEKIHEELFHSDEPLTDTGYDKILLANCRSVEYAVVSAEVDRLASACANYDHAELERIIEILVPEYDPVREQMPQSNSVAVTVGEPG